MVNILTESLCPVYTVDGAALRKERERVGIGLGLSAAQVGEQR